MNATMKVIRNLVFVGLMVGWAISYASLGAQALTCNWISPSGPGAECQTSTTNMECSTSQNGPEWAFCDADEADTCNAFCGSNEVVDSSCGSEHSPYILEGSGGMACLEGLSIWCKCSDQ